MCSVWVTGEPCLAVEKSSYVSLWHVGSSWVRDQTWVSCIVRHILFHWATRDALLPLFLGLLDLTGVQCYFTVVLVCNFLMIYDFEYFWYAYLLSVYFLWPGVQIYTFLIRLFVPAFLVYLEYNPLSDMYFSVACV